MRVLVVEDFEPMARAIGTGLRREGMAVECTATRSAGGSRPSGPRAGS